eukprot:m.166889 g.166889  ORF g.166889 m.166889 type:complete len:79 (+) comp17759_c0_seq2:584-820(+)
MFRCLTFFHVSRFLAVFSDLSCVRVQLYTVRVDNAVRTSSALDAAMLALLRCVALCSWHPTCDHGIICCAAAGWPVKQ